MFWRLLITIMLSILESLHYFICHITVGIQHPITSSPAEFPDFLELALVSILWFRPCWCPSPFLSPSISRCYSIHSSSPAIGFHSCFYFTTNVPAPIGRPFTYFFGEFPGF